MRDETKTTETKGDDMIETSREIKTASAAAFERFMDGLDAAADWDAESIDLDEEEAD